MPCFWVFGSPTVCCFSGLVVLRVLVNLCIHYTCVSSVGSVAGFLVCQSSACDSLGLVYCLFVIPLGLGYYHGFLPP